jgi:xylose isomerase
MNTGFFEGLKPAKFEGAYSNDPMAFHHYNSDEIILGKSMKEHLRFAVAYWHSFAWEGGDPFGGPTFERPWHPQDEMGRAKMKADVAFEMFDLLQNPFFCWHDADVRPEGDTLAQSISRLDEITDYFMAKMENRDVGLLWGTANMFSHRRWMSGASTNPDPEIFAYAVATVKSCMDATLKMGGQNYVLWGGREGYETLLNTNMGRELDHMGRFLHMVVEYKHKIGYKGQIQSRNAQPL